MNQVSNHESRVSWKPPDPYHQPVRILLQMISVIMWVVVLTSFILHPFSVMFNPSAPPPIISFDEWLMKQPHFNYMSGGLIVSPILLIGLIWWLDVCFRSIKKTLVHTFIPFLAAVIITDSIYRFYLLPDHSIQISRYFYILGPFFLTTVTIAFIHIRLINRNRGHSGHHEPTK